MLAERLIDPNTQPEDHPEVSLRPKALKDFVGQAQVRENLQVFIDAAKKRHEALDHVLFFGPPGLGKTTLSQIISSELGVGFRATSGPIISKAGDLAAILTNLQPRDVLFIDEIHRLNAHIEEVLYPAMEDFKLDLIIGEGPAARSIRIDLPPFTLVAATTRTGLMTSPLRDRFGIPLRLDYYTAEELEHIVMRGAHLLKMSMNRDAVQEIAKRSRGTPRIAGRLLRRIRDFAFIKELETIDLECVDTALQKLGVDKKGLDNLDRLYLERMATIYAGGPVGIDTMAAVLSEQRDSLEEVVEPFLIQQGFVQKTPRGRILTQDAYTYLGLPFENQANPPIFSKGD